MRGSGDTKVSAKRKAEASTRASKKAAKDPNKPKRPPSAFFVFMEDFRQTYKEKNPNNKSVAAVAKSGGAKWKSMSDAEKAPFVAKAEKRKADYTKQMAAYDKKGGASAADEEEEAGSDKSKSEVHDGEDDDESGEEDDD